MRYGLTNQQLLNICAPVHIPLGSLTDKQLADCIRREAPVLYSGLDRLTGTGWANTATMTILVYPKRAVVTPSVAFRSRLAQLPRMEMSKQLQAYEALVRRVANQITALSVAEDTHGADDYEGSPYHFNLTENCHALA